MTKLLERAIAEVNKLPAGAQDRVASRLLDEIIGESLADEPERTLADLLAAARVEYERGETKPMSKNCVIANDQRFP